jgi:hypothetical protein
MVFQAMDKRLYIKGESGQIWRARKFEDGKVERFYPRWRRRVRQWKRLGVTLDSKNF